MSNFDPHSYSVLTRRVHEDGEAIFKATVKELPHVAEFGETQAKVYDLAIDTIEGLHKMAGEMGHDFPDPIVEDEDYSGRVTLRMPKSLHRSVASTAEAEGVSINHFLVTAITEKVTAGNVYAAIVGHIDVRLASYTSQGRLRDAGWYRHSSQEAHYVIEGIDFEVKETAITSESVLLGYMHIDRKPLQLLSS